MVQRGSKRPLVFMENSDSKRQAPPAKQQKQSKLKQKQSHVAEELHDIDDRDQVTYSTPGVETEVTICKWTLGPQLFGLCVSDIIHRKIQLYNTKLHLKIQNGRANRSLKHQQYITTNFQQIFQQLSKLFKHRLMISMVTLSKYGQSLLLNASGTTPWPAGIVGTDTSRLSLGERQQCGYG